MSEDNRIELPGTLDDNQLVLELSYAYTALKDVLSDIMLVKTDIGKNIMIKSMPVIVEQLGSSIKKVAETLKDKTSRITSLENAMLDPVENAENPLHNTAENV